MLGISLLSMVVCCTIASASGPLYPVRSSTDNHIREVVQPLVDDPAIVHRLPSTTRPISYDIHVTTNIHTQTDFSFTGEVAIRFRALRASRTITLHQRQLTIGNASLILTDQPNIQIPLNPAEYNSENEFLSFTLQSPTALLIGSREYILTIAYNGTLRTDEAGFYRSSYLTENGTRR